MWYQIRPNDDQREGVLDVHFWYALSLVGWWQGPVCFAVYGLGIQHGLLDWRIQAKYDGISFILFVDVYIEITNNDLLSSCVDIFVHVCS